MKKVFVFSCISLCLLMAAGCNDDANEGIKTSCGDGVLNNDEICDGTEFAEGVKVCPEGLVLKNADAFACTATCGVDFTKACAAPSCGDGDLSGAELCDGDKFRSGVKLCPAGMEEVEEPVYTCTDTCLIDISQACRVKSDGQGGKFENPCGNGELDEGELCDGEAFADGAKACPDGMVMVDENAFACTSSCGIDFSLACVVPSCGNGQLDDNEICDGDAFADGVQVCPSGTTAMENPVFGCTDKCQLDISAACTPNELVQCGDGVLSGAEVCDGEQFAEGAKVCPGDMVELENAVYSCTDKCQIDISKACVSSICGDGKVTGQEVCDLGQFKEGAKVCPDDKIVVPDRDLFVCDSCTLNTEFACMEKGDVAPTLYFSEIRMLDDKKDPEHAAHLYIEIGNLGTHTPIGDCKLVGVNLDKTDATKIDPNFVFEYPFAYSSVFNPRGILGHVAGPNIYLPVVTVCYESSEGWLKNQYDSKTTNMDACESTWNYQRYKYYECVLNQCEDETDTKCIEQNCLDLAQAESDYLACQNKVNMKKLDEACLFNVPASNTNLLLTKTRSTYKSDKIWGLGLVCGDNVHDIIKLYDIPNDAHGTNRICSKLTDIKATGDVIKDVSWWDYNDPKSRYTSNYENVTYGKATCGENRIN